MLDPIVKLKNINVKIEKDTANLIRSIGEDLQTEVTVNLYNH